MSQAVGITLVIVLVVIVIAAVWMTIARRAKTCPALDPYGAPLAPSGARPSPSAYAQDESVDPSRFQPSMVAPERQYAVSRNVFVATDSAGLADGRSNTSPLIAKDGTPVVPYTASNASSESVTQPELFKAFTDAPEGVAAKLWPTNIDGTAENTLAAILPGNAKDAAEVQKRYAAASSVNTYLEGANYMSMQSTAKANAKTVGRPAGVTFELFADYFGTSTNSASPIIDCDKMSQRFLPENHPCYEAVVKKLKAEEAEGREGVTTGFGSMAFRDMNQR